MTENCQVDVDGLVQIISSAQLQAFSARINEYCVYWKVPDKHRMYASVLLCVLLCYNRAEITDVLLQAS